MWNLLPKFRLINIVNLESFKTDGYYLFINLFIYYVFFFFDSGQHLSRQGQYPILYKPFSLVL